MVLLMTASVTGCASSSIKASNLKFDPIEPEESDFECMSDSLVDQLLKYNCKLLPEIEYCK